MAASATGREERTTIVLIRGDESDHLSSETNLIVPVGTQAEAGRLRHLLEHYAQRPVRDLLDMACGTGLYDQYLKKHYYVEGADLSPAQLAIARRRCPDLVFHQADMTNFDLGRDYDAVTCLFSAIGHVITEEKLRAAVRAMGAHVRPGGLVVIEPFIDPSDFRPGHLSVDQGNDGEAHVVRVSYSDPLGIVDHLKTGRLDRISQLVGGEHGNVEPQWLGHGYLAGGADVVVHR